MSLTCACNLSHTDTVLSLQPSPIVLPLFGVATSTLQCDDAEVTVWLPCMRGATKPPPLLPLLLCIVKAVPMRGPAVYKPLASA